MSFRKMLLSACASGVLFAVGAITHVLAADRPQGDMAGDRAAWHQQMCNDRFAQNAGRVAYIEARLSLTDSQRPLFDSWKQTVMGSAKARESECMAHQPQGGPHDHSILARQARMQEMLQHRLSDLTAEQPSLKSLYDSLSPQQKQVFDRGGPEGHGPHGDGMWHGGHDGRGDHGGPQGPHGQGA
jgi:hypothetical protein